MRWLLTAALLLTPVAGVRGTAEAIDFYEIQIYGVDTTPEQHLTLELHSNTVSTATGRLAHEQIRPYEIHETIEATYGLTRHIEVGQYFATAKLDNGNYEYAGSRTKVHFGLIDPETWPFGVGGNVELDYMRHAAEDQPFTLEMRPILARHWERWWVAANFAFEKPFSGSGTHRGVTFAPSGMVTYDLVAWISPSVEYYGDMGPIRSLPGVQRQQHFIVPAANLHIFQALELNLGVGFGVTRASNGVFLKSIVGWTF